MDQFILGLANKLQPCGWRIACVFGREPDVEFLARLRALDVEVLTVDWPLSTRRAATLAFELKRRFRPTVLHTHFLSKFDPNLAVLKFGSGARTLIATDHSSWSISGKRGLRALFAKVRSHWLNRHVDSVISVSEFNRRRNIVGVHYPESRIHVIHNGVDTESHSPVYHAVHQPARIAFAGQLILQKGVLTLLRAAKILYEAGIDFSLQIAGVGDLRQELEQLVAEFSLGGRVRFLGQIDWVPRLFADADIVVVPSEWDEAFGMVCAEAAACGACVVASSAGALPEVLGMNEEAGLIFKKGDAHDLARQIERVIVDEELRNRLRVGARERVLRMFTIERMVDRYSEFITNTGPSPANR